MISGKNGQLETLTFLLVIIGALNWAIVAYQSKDVVPDLFSLILPSTYSIPGTSYSVTVKEVQTVVYYAVAGSAIVLLTLHMKGTSASKK